MEKIWLALDAVSPETRRDWVSIVRNKLENIFEMEFSSRNLIIIIIIICIMTCDDGKLVDVFYFTSYLYYHISFRPDMNHSSFAKQITLPMVFLFFFRSPNSISPINFQRFSHLNRNNHIIIHAINSSFIVFYCFSIFDRSIFLAF